MELIPTEEEVVAILRETHALRKGHFEYTNGIHSDEYLQVPIAMRSYQHAKMLNVALSRRLRSKAEIRAMIPDLSIVAPATGGLPVAFGICEALRAKQVYWAERENEQSPMRFRQFIEPKPGEPVVLVDDILRSGNKMSEMLALLKEKGATVVAIAVIVYQPMPTTHGLGGLSLFSLARLQASYYADAATCELCRNSVPLEKVWV